MKHISILVLFLAIHLGSASAQDDNPGWLHSESATPEEVAAQVAAVTSRSAPSGGMVAPSFQITEHAAAAPLSEAQALSAPTPTGGGNDADEITPEISALAAGLHYDPLKIFEYVHNYIEFEPYYGSKKGAHLTLLEGSGNDFDQASLLVALLRASGKNPTYKYGACDFSYFVMTLWTGLSATPYSYMTNQQFSDYYLGLAATPTNRKLAAGIEFFKRSGYYISDPYLSGGEVIFTVPQVWVELSVDNVTRQMLPALKPHDDFAGIDLVSATGYSRSQILADAAGTVSSSPDSVTSLNYGNISSRLGNYSQALGTYLKNNKHEMDVDQVTGTRHIRMSIYRDFSEIDPVFVWDTCPWQAVETWSAIPVAQMSKIQIKCGTYNYNAASPAFTTTLFNQTRNMPGLKGRKLSLAWSGNTASICLDETLVGSPFTVTGGTVDIQLTASHNHFTRSLASPYADSAFGRNNQSETKPYLKGDSYAYAFPYCFGNPEKTSRARQEVLDGYRRRNLTESDWRVKTEILNIMGLQWYYQTWKQAQVIAPLFDMLPLWHHRFGRVAQETSYYIDVGLQASSDSNRDENVTLEKQFFQFGGFVSSAMEHGVIEQMQGDDKSATSTIKMIYLANQQAIPIYRATASNWNTVRGQLINYSGQVTTAGHFLFCLQYKITTAGNTNFTHVGAANNAVGTIFTATGAGTGTGKATPTGTAELENAVNSTTDPGIALLPKNGQITVNQWKGFGYAIERPSSMSMKISGGYFGGYNSQTGTVSAASLGTWATSSPSYTASATSGQNVPYTPYTTPTNFAAEPVEMLSGAWVSDKTELTVGSGSSRRGLSFSRHYNSNSRYDKSPGLGYGWTHSYEISATKRSSVTAGLAGTISYQATPFFAAMQVAADLYKNHTNAKEWSTAALAVHWAIDQLRYKAVAITLGNRTIEFIRMPDGSYEPPAGMNMTLTLNSSGASEYFTLTERNGPTYTFNTAGRIASITDLWGQSQTFTYTAGLLTGVADSYGRTLTFSHTAGRITSVSDQSGRSVVFAYTGDDITSCTDVEGKVWSYLYDTDHKVTDTKDPFNRVIVHNNYDAKGRVTEQLNAGDANETYTFTYTGYCNTEEDPASGRTCYLYDQRGRTVAIIDALGNRSEIYYDGHDRKLYTISPELEQVDFYHDKNNNLTTTTDEVVLDTVMTYDAQNRVETITDKRGKVTTFSLYNAQHQPTRVTAPLARETNTTYTTTGEVDTVTDPEGNVTDHHYNSLGQLQETLVNGHLIASYTYNLYGDVETMTDGLSHTITYTYNKRRQLRTTTLTPIPGQPSAVIETTYDDAGMPASTIDSRSNTTGYTYSTSEKILTTTQPAIPVNGGSSLNNVTITTYEHRDLPATTSNSLGHSITVVHDEMKRVKQSTDPLNRTSLISYDKDSRPKSMTDPLSRVTSTDYTARGETWFSYDALTKNTRMIYDENGNAKERRNRRGKTHLTTYDDANRLSASTTPTGKTTTTTYYKNDLVHTITKPSTQVTTLTYDSRLRPHTRTDPAGTITYGYSNASELLTVTEGTAVITRTYDERGRLKTYTNADGDLIQFQYDAAGNITRLTYPPDTTFPTGRQVNYTYNARNQLETVIDWSNRVTTYTYDRLGRLTGTIRPNGTSNQIAHDAAGQLLSIKENANGKLISYFNFQYDAAGQITKRFRAPLVNTGWKQPIFTATYDDDNRLATVNGQNVSIDPDGNMTNGPIKGSTSVPPVSINLTYNSRNQLTNADGVTYTYDSEGTRRTQTDSTGLTTDVTAPGGQLLIRHHPDGSKTYYIYGLGLLYEANEADATKTYHFDQVGSTIARTDDTGKVIGEMAYSPYGLITWKHGDMATPFQYNGQAGVQTDPNGLLNMRARYYSPYLMRFLNVDPSGFSGGSNWFAYADGNPISRSDPFGLEAAQNDLWGQVKDKANSLAESMLFATQDPQGAAAAGADRLIDGAFGGGNTLLGHVEPLKSAGVYQEGSSADRGGDFMATYAISVGFIAGASEAFSPRPRPMGNGMTRVTSWADVGVDPDLNVGRWVQIGEATPANFRNTGLNGPKIYPQENFPFFKIESSKASLTNFITDSVPTTSLEWPGGWESIKGIRGQRIIGK